MSQHEPKPAQLRDDYEQMLDDLVPLIAPYLPANVQLFAIGRARQFGADLSTYADIDQVFQALRRNGLPNSTKHRVYQLIHDHIKTYEARQDDPTAA